MTLLQFIERQRIERARKLLEHTAPDLQHREILRALHLRRDVLDLAEKFQVRS